MKHHWWDLSKEQYDIILNLLLQYEDLFDGTLNDFHTIAVHLEVKKDVVPKHHKAFLVPRIYKEILNKELGRLG